MQVMKKVGVIFLLTIAAVHGFAAIRWTGMAGNGRWDDPLNWENAVLPAATDEVVLDNNYVSGPYTVILPDMAVTVSRIQIGGPSIIQLILPVSNNIVSAAGSPDTRALTLTGGGYALEIGEGAVFVNASGSSSGYSIRIADSILVQNGGRFVHRTRTGHAELVERLSRRPGTEKGIFRFENTDAASVISLSGRVYGRLELSAKYAPGQQISYTAAGTNDALIRSDFVLEQGVRLAFNFSNTINILGNLEAHGASMNLASAARSLTLDIKKDIFWENGLIESNNVNGATGRLLLAGNQPQHVFMGAAIGSATKLVLNNLAGCIASSDLSVLHELQLQNGALTMENGTRVLLGASATLLSDSLNDNTYIDGLVRKIGWNGAALRFPLGKNNRQRWIVLTGGSGDIELGYYGSSALSLSGQMATGIDHVSDLEYWSVALSQPSLLKVSLSFATGVSGILTDPGSLRVAHLVNSSWTDAGNAATTGNTDYGSVSSDLIHAGTSLQLTLASNLAGENILPMHITDQQMQQWNNRWVCRFRVLDISAGDSCFIEWSADGFRYEKITAIPLLMEQSFYQETIPAARERGFCRIVLSSADGNKIVGKPMRFGVVPEKWAIQVLPIRNQSLVILSDQSCPTTVQLFDGCGRLLVRQKIVLQKGSNQVFLRQKQYARGNYVVMVTDNNQFSVSRQVLLQ